MIFKRREKLSFQERLYQVVVPRKSVWRTFDYFGKRIRRLPDSPHRIALGFACGATASFSPFFGFHFFFAAALAWLVRGNLLASAFGTIVGNPITFPFIATASLSTGWWLFGEAPMDSGDGFSIGWLVDNLSTIFFPYLIGGLVPGAICGAVTYVVIGPLVAAYQERRRKKLEASARRRRKERDKELSAYEMHDAEGDNA
ncbi:MAG: DUF2062 domain-containing protein [Pseudomonadota bacterium]